MLAICKNPELMTQVTLMPVNRFEVDAAIIYADILTLPLALGVDLDFIDSRGPVIKKRMKNSKDIKDLLPFFSENIDYLLTGIKMVKKELNEERALIGFSGLPFTLVSYLIEGGSSKNFALTKEFMYRRSDLWAELMQILTKAISGYISAQVKSGVDVIQLFDSWVGCLDRKDYLDYVFPYTRKILKEARLLNVPIIHFGVNTAAFFPDLAAIDCDVIGVDWRTPLNEARRLLGPSKAIQGNLDPSVLLADFDFIKRKTDQVLKDAEGRPGHIFNLGHGMLPQTPVSNVSRLTDYVHSQTL